MAGRRGAPNPAEPGCRVAAAASAGPDGARRVQWRRLPHAGDERSQGWDGRSRRWGRRVPGRWPAAAASRVPRARVRAGQGLGRVQMISLGIIILAKHL